MTTMTASQIAERFDLIQRQQNWHNSDGELVDSKELQKGRILVALLVQNRIRIRELVGDENSVTLTWVGRWLVVRREGTSLLYDKYARQFTHDENAVLLAEMLANDPAGCLQIHDRERQ